LHIGVKAVANSDQDDQKLQRSPVIADNPRDAFTSVARFIEKQRDLSV